MNNKKPEKQTPKEQKEPKEKKEPKETKEPKEKKETKEVKETKEPKEKKEPKEVNEPKEVKDPKVTKEPQEKKEPKEVKEPKEPKEAKKPKAKKKKSSKSKKRKKSSKKVKKSPQKTAEKNAKSTVQKPAAAPAAQINTGSTIIATASNPGDAAFATTTPNAMSHFDREKRSSRVAIVVPEAERKQSKTTAIDAMKETQTERHFFKQRDSQTNLTAKQKKKVSKNKTDERHDETEKQFIPYTNDDNAYDDISIFSEKVTDLRIKRKK